MGYQMLLEVRGCGKGFRALTAFVIFNLVVYLQENFIHEWLVGEIIDYHIITLLI